MQKEGFLRRRQIFNQRQLMSGHFAQVGTNFFANLIEDTSVFLLSNRTQAMLKVFYSSQLFFFITNNC